MTLNSLLNDIETGLHSNIKELGEKVFIDRIDIYKIIYDEDNHPVKVKSRYHWLKKGKSAHEPYVETKLDALSDIYSKIENNIPIKGSLDDYEGSGFLHVYGGDFKHFVILSLQHKSDLWGFMVFLMEEDDIKWMGDDLLTLMEYASKIAKVVINEDLIANLANVESEYWLLTRRGIDLYLRVDRKFIIKSVVGKEIENRSEIPERFIGKPLKELIAFSDISELNRFINDCLMCINTGKPVKRNLFLNVNEPGWYSVQCYPINKNIDFACVAIKVDDVLRPLKENELWMGLHKKLFGNMRNAIMVVTHDEVLDVSPNIVDITGLDAEKVRKGFLSNNPEIFDVSTMTSMCDVLSRFRQGNNANCRIKGKVVQGAGFFGDVEIFIKTIDSTVLGKDQLLMIEIENTFVREEIERLTALIGNKYAMAGVETCVYMLGIDGSILWANKEGEKLIEVDYRGTDRKIGNYFEKEHQDAIMREIMSPFMIKRRSNIVNHRLLIAGEEIEVLTVSSLTYKGGAPHAVLCVSRRVAQNYSALGYQQGMVIEDMSSEIRWAMDMDLYFTYVSPSVKHILGYTRERAMSEGLGGILSDKSDERLGNCLRSGLSAAKKNKPWSKALPVEFISDGKTIKGRMVMNLIYDHGKPVSFVGVTEFAGRRFKGGSRN